MRSTLAQRILVLGLAACLCTIAVGMKGLVTGWGGSPVTQTLTSLWLAGHEGVQVKPLLVVYFHGPPNWFNRSGWRQEFQQNQSPGGVRLTAEGIDLKIEASIEGETATVQGQTFARRENNVFLVLGADQPVESQRVVPLGRYELTGDGKRPIPVVLHENPTLRARLDAETPKNP